MCTFIFSLKLNRFKSADYLVNRLSFKSEGMHSRSRKKAEATVTQEEVGRVVRNIKDYIKAAVENGYILPHHGGNLINR